MPDADRYHLQGGQSVLIETTPVEVAGQIEFVSRGNDGAIDFSAAVDKALPAARLLVQKLETLITNVKTIEVEFGLKFSGEVGALIAKTGTEANFTIKLTWSPASEPKHD